MSESITKSESDSDEESGSYGYPFARELMERCLRDDKFLRDDISRSFRDSDTPLYVGVDCGNQNAAKMTARPLRRCRYKKQTW